MWREPRKPEESNRHSKIGLRLKQRIEEPQIMRSDAKAK